MKSLKNSHIRNILVCLGLASMVTACADQGDLRHYQVEEIEGASLHEETLKQGGESSAVLWAPRPQARPLHLKAAAPSENPQQDTEAVAPSVEESVRPVPRPQSIGSLSEQQDMVGPGALKPTIYYFAVYDEDQSECEATETLHGAGGVELHKICAETLKRCSLQGSCGVIQKGERRDFNIIGRFNGQERYFELKDQKCSYGYGVKNSCLDPFYTLAADLSIYSVGEVIFIPAVVGTVLPDGSKHNGYFVIRDRGRGIKGHGRFDFFTGTLSWINNDNPFKKLGLGDVNTSLPYYRVGGIEARKVLNARFFPTLPATVVHTQ